MNAVLFGLLVAAGAVNDRVNLQQVQIDVVLCQGDPLGSRAEGTVKHIAEPRIVTQSGRPALFRTGGGPFDPEAGGKNTAEWVGTTVELLPVACANGKVYVEVNATRREACPGLGIQVRDQVRPGFTEQCVRLSRSVAQGEKFRFRIAADSPGSQTWAEVTVRQFRPEK